MIKRNEFRWLLLIAALTILVRGIFFLVYMPHTPQLEDRDFWLQIARNLDNGNGYSSYIDMPTAKRGPVGVYFFAALLWLFGDHALPILLGQWLVEAGTS